MNLVVDLNADLGEGSGFDRDLLKLVSSANIACGFHAGDASSIRETICAARECGVSVGAHPSLFDRENFGRKEFSVTPADVSEAVTYQLGVFQAISEALGVRPDHVKPHGALYNMAARDEKLAQAVASAVAGFDLDLTLFAAPGSRLAEQGLAHGLKVAREVFADRNYLSDGSLVPRSRPDALLHDPVAAGARALRMLREGKVMSIEGREVEVRAETICLHGDTPGAVEFAKVLRAQLENEGVAIQPPKPAR